MNGELNAHLVWDSDPAERLDKAQRFIDSECLVHMKKYTPKLNKILVKSATNGTKIGSGHIIYNSPYARYQYYGKVMVSTGGKTSKKVVAKPERYLKYNNPQATRLWFEVMKKKHGTAILRGAAAAAGGRV